MKISVFFADCHNTLKGYYSKRFPTLKNVIVEKSAGGPKLALDLNLTATGKIINGLGNHALFTDNGINTYILFKHSIPLISTSDLLNKLALR